MQVSEVGSSVGFQVRFRPLPAGPLCPRVPGCSPAWWFPSLPAHRLAMYIMQGGARRGWADTCSTQPVGLRCLVLGEARRRLLGGGSVPWEQQQQQRQGKAAAAAAARQRQGSGSGGGPVFCTVHTRGHRHHRYQMDNDRAEPESTFTLSYMEMIQHLVEDCEPQDVYARFVASFSRTASACDPEQLFTQKQMIARYAQEAVQAVGRIQQNSLLAKCSAQDALRVIGAVDTEPTYRESARSLLFDFFVDKPNPGEPLGQPEAYPDTDEAAAARITSLASASAPSRVEFLRAVMGQTRHICSPMFVVEGKMVDCSTAATTTVQVLLDTIQDDPVTFVHALRGSALLKHALPNTAPRCSFQADRYPQSELTEIEGIVPPYCRLEWAHPLSQAVFRLFDRVLVAMISAMGFTDTNGSILNRKPSSYSVALHQRVNIFRDYTASMFQAVMEATLAALMRKSTGKGKKGRRKSAILKLLVPPLQAESKLREKMLIVIAPTSSSISGTTGGLESSDEFQTQTETGETGSVTRKEVYTQLLKQQGSSTSSDMPRSFAQAQRKRDGRQKRIGRQTAAGPGYRAGGASDLYAEASEIHEQDGHHPRNTTALHTATSSDLDDSCVKAWASVPADCPRKQRRRAMESAVPDLRRAFTFQSGDELATNAAAGMADQRIQILQTLVVAQRSGGSGFSEDVADFVPLNQLVLFLFEYLRECKTPKGDTTIVHLALHTVDMGCLCVGLALDKTKNSERTQRQVLKNLRLDQNSKEGLNCAQSLWGCAELARALLEMIGPRSGQQFKQEIADSQKAAIAALNSCVQLLTGIQGALGLGTGPLLSVNGGPVVCASTVVDLLAPLSRYGKPESVAYNIASALNLWLRQQTGCEDFLKNAKSRVRACFLDQGIMACLCAVVSPKCQSKGLTENVSMWSLIATETLDFLAYFAVQHPGLCIKFGLHHSMLALLKAYSAVLQSEPQNGSTPAGTRVVIVGLQNGTAYNGKEAQIQAWVPGKCRFSVAVTQMTEHGRNAPPTRTTKLLALKIENLQRMGSTTEIQPPPSRDEALAEADQIHPLVAQMEGCGDLKHVQPAQVYAACATVFGSLGMSSEVAEGVKSHLIRTKTVAILSLVLCRRVRCIANGRISLDAHSAELLNQIARCAVVLITPTQTDEHAETIVRADLQSVEGFEPAVRRLLRHVDSKLAVPEQISLMRHLSSLPLNICEVVDDSMACYKRNLSALMSVIAGVDGRDFQDAGILHNAIQQVSCSLMMIGKSVFDGDLASTLPAGTELPDGVNSRDMWSLSPESDTTAEAMQYMPALLPRMQLWIKQRQDLGGAPEQFLQFLQILTSAPQQVSHVQSQLREQLAQPARTTMRRLNPPGSKGGNVKFSQEADQEDVRTGFGVSCSNCGVGEVGPGVKMSKCGGAACPAVYCSSKCQRVDWRHGHKAACGSHEGLEPPSDPKPEPQHSDPEPEPEPKLESVLAASAFHTLIPGYDAMNKKQRKRAREKYRKRHNIETGLDVTDGKKAVLEARLAQSDRHTEIEAKKHRPSADEISDEAVAGAETPADVARLLAGLASKKSVHHPAAAARQGRRTARGQDRRDPPGR